MSGARATGRRNRLAEATSPYLLQHAENPVDWHEWGEEALGRAKKEDKPILLSIGYSACHWCHVMAHESFEDTEIGAQMSRDFVCIKVDREERPDLDDVYMAATLAMNHGQGGWPMTVFLTPDQEPFFAGTYFPPEDRWGRPGFRSLLTRIAEAWRDDRDGIREQGARLAEHLRENARAAPGLQLGESEIRGAVAQLDRAFDERHGGFGAAPKFPPSVALSLLLRAWRRFGDERALDMARRTLDAMARGGMYDQLAGGFHRYSVDAEWLVPHFEKMLYDNAQLARIYTDAWAATGEPFYRRIATEILDYVLREMTDPGGGFYSATDADSEGEEGRFFVWTPDAVREGLGDAEAAERFCAFYDVTEAGNWEGRSILRTLREPAEVARELGLAEEDLVRELEASRRTLLEVRSRRVAPGLDDKVLTAWNGLMLGAFAEAARVFGEPRYLEAARRNAGFLLGALRRDDGGLLRTWRRGRAQLDAYLEDYAHLAGALVDLYEASGERADLDTAAELADRLRRDFAAPDGGFYSVAEGHERLIVRPREGHDGAIPNANASAAHALARLGFHLGRDELRDEAARALRAWGRVIAQHPRGFCRALEVADLLLEGPVELAVVGTPGAADFEALLAELGRHYTPNRVIARTPAGAAVPSHPLLEGREGVDGRAALYVCRDFVCRRPVTAPGGVADALAAHRAEAPEAPRTLTLPGTPGAATPEGTAAWAERHRERLPHGYGPLGKTGLTCSRIGFGGYRVDDDDAEHREALVRAVLSGINLIDTASTYTLGASERLVGEVVADLTRGGSAAREELIVVSKLGFLQGPSLERARERADAGSPWPELVRLSDTAWHCIHPAFLDDELDESLERLRLERIDLLLLHNPESFLEANGGEGDRESGRGELERRLEQAFSWAESAVASGRIGGYGISSNSLALGTGDPRALPREAVLGAALRAGGEAHGFVALQVPLNVLEGEAALRSEGGETLLAWARRQGLGVLANRPLNAARDGRVVRLAEFEVGAPADLDAALEALGALEEEFRKGLATRLRTGTGLPGPDKLFRWSKELDEIRRQRPGLPQWAQIEAAQLHPRLLRTLASLDRALEGSSLREWHAWRERYLPHLERALHELDRRARERSREEAAPAAHALEARLPAERRGESLSRQALWTAASVPGVSCALVGMRRTAYVADAVEVLRWPLLGEAEDVLRDLAR